MLGERGASAEVARAKREGEAVKRCGTLKIKIAVATGEEFAGVAQLVEHLICNQRVGGSNPFASSRQHKSRD